MKKGKGSSIMRLREKTGKTQRQIADAVGVTVQTVSNWETGRRQPTLTPIQTLKLCNVLECTLEELAENG